VTSDEDLARRVEVALTGCPKRITLSDDPCPNPAAPDHPCPYRVEIHDDSTNLCRCCSSCRKECAYDV
jgi:hypothetical protein